MTADPPDSPDPRTPGKLGAAVGVVRDTGVAAARGTRSMAFGFGCAMRGFTVMATRPLWWPWAVTPVVLALGVFGGLSWWALDSGYVAMRDWLSQPFGEVTGIAAGVVSVIVMFVVLLVIFYVAFAPFARLVAAPFVALFSERVVRDLSGVEPPRIEGSRFVRMVLRPIGEAAVLLLVRLAVTLLALPLNFIPFVGQIAFAMVLAPMEAMDLLDWAQSARGVPLSRRLPFLRRNRAACTGLGLGALLFLAIPVVNVFALPALMVGAVLLDRELSDDFPRPPAASEPA